MLLHKQYPRYANNSSQYYYQGLRGSWNGLRGSARGWFEKKIGKNNKAKFPNESLFSKKIETDAYYTNKTSNFKSLLMDLNRSKPPPFPPFQQHDAATTTTTIRADRHRKSRIYRHYDSRQPSPSPSLPLLMLLMSPPLLPEVVTVWFALRGVLEEAISDFEGKGRISRGMKIKQEINLDKQETHCSGAKMTHLMSTKSATRR